MTPTLKKYISIILILLTFLTLFFAWTYSKEVNSMGALLTAGSTGKDGRMANKLVNGIPPTSMGAVMKWSNGGGHILIFLYRIILIVTMLLMAHAIAWHWLDRKYNGFGVLIGIVLLFVAFLIVMGSLNKELGAALSWYGIVVKYRITAWPFISLVFAAGSVGMWMWYSQDVRLNTAPIDFNNLSQGAASIGKDGLNSVKSFVGNINIGGKTDWTCPNCGTVVDKNSIFCPRCGTPRPEPKKCSYCGNILDDGTMFCGKCGKQYVEPVICPTCSAQVPGGVEFCGNCGTKVK